MDTQVALQGKTKLYSMGIIRENGSEVKPRTGFVRRFVCNLLSWVGASFLSVATDQSNASHSMEKEPQASARRLIGVRRQAHVQERNLGWQPASRNP